MNDIDILSVKVETLTSMVRDLMREVETLKAKIESDLEFHELTYHTKGEEDDGK